MTEFGADFGLLKTDAGLKKLNEHLSTRSYISGVSATKDDMKAFSAIRPSIPSNKFPHVLRWYSHIRHLEGTSPMKNWGTGTKENKPQGANKAEKPVDNKNKADKQAEKKEPKAKPERKEKPRPEVTCKVEPWADRSKMKPVTEIQLGPGAQSPADAPKTEKHYITTAIMYTNGKPHIGHAYEMILSDVMARYQRLYGRDLFFLTGTDEHGQKIATAAEEKGMTPIELCDMYVNDFKVLYQRLRTSEDFFIRTTHDHHEDNARSLWEMCAKTVDDIYLSAYEGWYNVKEETFVTDMEAQESNFLCPLSGNPLQRMTEESYFFRMSKYQDRLVQHIKENPECIQPESFRNQILARLSEPLRDLCISRTKVEWGVRVPKDFDQKHTMYVWFDALSNYLSGIGALSGSDNARFWPADHHVIGKDILWFHSVIWPCMLFSANLPVPKSVMVHGFVLDAKGDKMSKSVGNVIDPHDLLDKYPCDSIRWYSIRAASYGADLKFSEKAMSQMHNAELLENLGNLVNRGTNLCQKYCDGKVPDVKIPAGTPMPFDLETLVRDVDAAMKTFGTGEASRKIVAASASANKWIADHEPWKMKDDRAEERTVVLRLLLDCLYVLGHFFAPFTPKAAGAIFEKLGTQPMAICNLNPNFENLKAGTKVSVGDVLFGLFEIESAAEQAKPQKEQKPKEKKPQKPAQKKPVEDPDRPIDDVTRLDIVVGKIVEAWEHPEADKLWCERIDVGEPELRTIASGLRAHYKQEEVQGADVLVLCNLKTRKMKGFESQGMVLCANAADGRVKFVTPPAGAKIGERVSFEGHTGKADEKLSEKKGKESWPAVMPGLRTDAKGVATYKGVPFACSTGVATSVEAPDSQIS